MALRAALALWALWPGAVQAEIVAAALAEPVTRYDHGVLGDAVEWGALRLTLADGRRVVMRLPESRVFEDLTARVADLDGDGKAEVVVVETDIPRGAMLAVYDASGRRAATAPLGQTHRWLAPAGIGDLDGDGGVEIAYVDRPHLARELVIVRVKGRRIVEIARLPGVTNHRVGEAVIRGGLRDCGAGPELVLADAGWTRALAVRFDGARLTARPLRAITGPADLDLAARCP